VKDFTRSRPAASLYFGVLNPRDIRSRCFLSRPRPEEHIDMIHARAVLLVSAVVLAKVAVSGPGTPAGQTSPDTAGVLETRRISGAGLPRDGIFFQPLGSNGRACATCHRPDQDWTISSKEIERRFDATQGRDPIFLAVDGAACNQPVDTATVQARRSAFSLLLDRGLIRMALPVPDHAEFAVVRVENHHGCSDRAVLSLYRRPLPVTNLRFLTTVMWDGRGSSPHSGTRLIGSAPAASDDLRADLAAQADDAARIHLQVSRPLTPEQQRSLVDFEMDLVTAQAVDSQAGPLDTGGAKGGAVFLATHTVPAFFVGINDPRRGDPHNIKAEDGFRLFDDWSDLPYGRVYTEAPAVTDPRALRRASISRGQVLFNQKPFDIRGVAGLNDELGLPSITGACGTCHDSPNAGNHSVAALLNIGTGDATSPLDLSYLPSITLRNRKTQQTVITTDPGLALVTGQWKDIGKVKVPVLRGLAARAPYFHNGSAKSLADVVNFYNQRFHIGFTEREKQDLIAFLSAL
jgi:cytochrome c peroxidase